MFIEGIKLRHMSEKQLMKRFKYLNPELINSIYDKKQDAIAAFGHYGNWEWIIGMHKTISYKVLTVYKPLHNKYFDKYFFDTRSKYGMELVPMASILRRILSNSREGVNTLTALVADQTPPRKEIHYTINFLNQETPVYLGVEKIARRFNMAVFFYNIRKVKRGYYEVEAELLTDNPQELKEHELTKMHMARLEKLIREKPEYWLWSHRRWKHIKRESE
jgi:KDO2-lipid IV(A) lauroyltransferase